MSSASMDSMSNLKSSLNHHMSYPSPVPSPVPQMHFTTSSLHRSDSISHLSSISNDGGGGNASVPSASKKSHRSASRTDETVSVNEPKSKPPKYIPSPTPMPRCRQKCPSYNFFIFSNTEMLIELLKPSKKRGKGVSQIVHFRFDMDRITWHKAATDELLPIDDDQSYFVSPSDAPTYSYDTMPSALWNKYGTASKLMLTMRNQLPRLTIYSSHAKATLFDSLQACEIAFYVPKRRFLFTKDEIKIFTNPDPTKKDDFISLKQDSSMNISTELQTLLEEAKQQRRMCIERERMLQGFVDAGQLDVFPTTFGRKPTKAEVELLSAQSNLIDQYQQQQQQQSAPQYHQPSRPMSSELRSASVHSLASSVDSRAPTTYTAQQFNYPASTTHQYRTANDVYNTASSSSSSNHLLYHHQQQQQQQQLNMFNRHHMSNC